MTQARIHFPPALLRLAHKYVQMYRRYLNSTGKLSNFLVSKFGPTRQSFVKFEYLLARLHERQLGSALKKFFIIL